VALPVFTDAPTVAEALNGLLVLPPASLIDSIYDAAIFPELWPAVLHQLGTLVDAGGGIILVRRSDSWLGWRFSDGLRGAKQFMESGAPGRSQTTARLLAFDRSGFVSDSELFSEDDFRKDSLVSEWAAPNGYFHAAATAIKTPSSDLVVIQVQREKQVAAFQSNDLTVLDAFRPHLARAGLLAVRLQFERLHAAATALEMVGLPAFVIDAAGRVICSNPLAEQLDQHVVWRASSRIGFADRRAERQFSKCLRSEPGARGASFASRPPTGGAPAIAHLIPLSRMTKDLFDGGIHFIVITPVVAAVPKTRILEGLFDLTPAEADIAARLASGMEMDRIAAGRGSSVETVRSQLKSVLAKTNTRRQAELVALIAGSAGLGSKT
jgi:DNA-binding CsgD family transcriptional regulator